MVFFAVIALALLLTESVRFEQRALQQPSIFALVILVLAMSAAGVRWLQPSRVEGNVELKFEEVPTPAVFELGLHRDGIMPFDTSADRRPKKLSREMTWRPGT